jgi:hypothetical protein
VLPSSCSSCMLLETLSCRHKASAGIADVSVQASALLDLLLRPPLGFDISAAKQLPAADAAALHRLVVGCKHASMSPECIQVLKYSPWCCQCCLQTRPQCKLFKVPTGRQIVGMSGVSCGSGSWLPRAESARRTSFTHILDCTLRRGRLYNRLYQVVCNSRSEGVIIPCPQQLSHASSNLEHHAHCISRMVLPLCSAYLDCS